MDKMKKWHYLLVSFLIVTLTAGLAGCETGGDTADEGSPGGATNPENLEGYVDARYRGIYDDSGENQITVQFVLEDDHFEEISFRNLKYDGIDYYEPEEAPADYVFEQEALEGIAQQYEAAIEYLEGEHISTLSELHEPDGLGLEPAEVDGMTAATIRTSKIISAMRDALNRGAYDNLQ